MLSVILLQKHVIYILIIRICKQNELIATKKEHTNSVRRTVVG